MSVKGATGSQLSHIIPLVRVPTQHFLNGVLEPYGMHWTLENSVYFGDGYFGDGDNMDSNPDSCYRLDYHYNKPIFPMILTITSPGGGILYICPANEGLRHNVRSSLIGRVHVQNDPCTP